MDRLLRGFLSQFVRRGSLTVTTAKGSKFAVGDGSGEPIAVRFVTAEAERKILVNPELGLGEAYMDGEFVVERSSIADALAILLDQPDLLPQWAKPWWHLRYLTRHLKQFNPRSRSRSNVAHHYDLDARLYSLFLDADKQYSCAYFETPETTLDDAQLAKKRHITAKLRVKRGQRVLDIGSGWGGLGRAGALSRGDRRRRRYRHHAVDRAVAGRHCARDREGSDQIGTLPAPGLSRH